MKRIIFAAALALPLAAIAFPVPSQDDYRAHSIREQQNPRAAHGSDGRMHDMQRGEHRMDNVQRGEHRMDNVQRGEHRMDNMQRGEHRMDNMQRGEHRMDDTQRMNRTQRMDRRSNETLADPHRSHAYGVVPDGYWYGPIAYPVGS